MRAISIPAWPRIRIASGRGLDVMTTITPCPLPETALLRAYQDGVAYTDCFSTDLLGIISHQQFVAAFYATWAFRPEQFILKWLLKKSSDDAGRRNWRQAVASNLPHGKSKSAPKISCCCVILWVAPAPG